MYYLEHHRGQFDTLQSVRTPRLVRAVGWMLGATVGVAVLFLVLVPWVQTTSGGGSVTALNPNDRLQEINALVPGRIQEWYVQDGSSVKAGDPIVQIVDNDPQLLQRLESERGQVVAQRNATQAALRTAEIDLRRTRGLFDKGLAARREFEQAQIRVEDLRARVAEVEAQLNRVDVNISRQSVQIVRAPRDGMILRVNAGDSATFVSAGQTVASFVPDNVTRAVEVFIDGRDVALVKPGDRARIQFEGWPAVQFSGWPSIAIGTFPGEVVAVDASADASGRFRVLLVEPEDGDTPWPEERF
ncbi:MAG: efflux RND transporter periplasmic adaptor subunit, partial [Hyphococcus sp.]